MREIVFGFTPEAANDPTGYLLRLGLPKHSAEWITRYVLSNKSMLELWGAPRKIVATLQRLHQKAWFRVDGLDSVINTFAGVRQGCKLGSIVFNAYYALGLTCLET